MFTKHNPDKSPTFTYHSSSGPIKGLITVPHAGLEIPKEFEDFLSSNRDDLDCDVDFSVHKLIDIEKLQAAGISVVVSNIHRTAVDLNRSEDKTILNWKKNSRGIKIVKQEPSGEQMKELLAKYYYPFFEMVKSLIQEIERQTAKPVPYIDLHSMPSKATEYHLKINPDQKIERPQFCLSDQNGDTCPEEFMESIRNSFIKKGYSPNVNDPYIGGHITRWANQFNTHNIQIEINRALYMDEEKRSLIQEKSSELSNNLTAIFLEFFSTR